MFRRPKDDQPVVTPYNNKYGQKKFDSPVNNEVPPRIFDTHTQPHVSNVSLPANEEKWAGESSSSFTAFEENESPETTLGEGVTFRGELKFDRFLKIDGIFEGELVSEGKIVVGPKGKVKANISLKEAIIEGEVEGNITCKERLELRGGAKVIGDIQAQTLVVDDGVSLLGHVQIEPHKGDLA